MNELYDQIDATVQDKTGVKNSVNSAKLKCDMHGAIIDPIMNDVAMHLAGAIKQYRAGMITTLELTDQIAKAYELTKEF